MTRDEKKPDERGSDAKEASEAESTEQRAQDDDRDEEHESELESAVNLRSRPAPPSPPLQTPAPRVEPVASRSEPEKSEESEDEELETRVERSPRREDLEQMRTLADRVYYRGWGHLSSEEQEAFLYHSRFLEHLSADERRRDEVRSTMYRFIGAQGKSLGLERAYGVSELRQLTDRFFGQVSTPWNRPDMYRRLADTDSYKPRERER